jgi:hypothetical protein
LGTIIGSAVETNDAIIDTAARSNDEDRCGLAQGAHGWLALNHRPACAFQGMPIEVERVSDEELEFDAKAKGPRSPEAQALARLRSQRSRDRQVYAFKFGNYVMIGALPDARTELATIELAEEDEEADHKG